MVPRARLAPALLLVLALLLTTATDTRAEPPQFWLPASVAVKLAPAWSLVVQAEPRWDEGGDAQVDRLLFRPAVVWEPVRGLTLWGGYGYTEVTPKDAADDQLTWQQAVCAFEVGGWTLAPRVRVEERFVERSAGVAWRLRGHIRAVRPLRRAAGWSFVTWHESFVPLNTVSGAQASGYSQGRFFLGVQRRVSRHLTIEPGYLALFNHRRKPLANDWDHAIDVGVQVRF